MRHDNDQLTLGELIDKLSTMDPDIVLNLCGSHSYRGFYDEIAFQEVPGATVKDLLNDTDRALSVPYRGWKGGEYRMYLSTPCWIAKVGDCGRALKASDLNSKVDPNVLWYAVINLNGIVTPKPARMKKSDLRETYWWDSSGTWDALEPGLAVKEGCIQYVAKDREDVRLFLLGAASFQKVLKNFCAMDENLILERRTKTKKKRKTGKRNSNTED